MFYLILLLLTFVDCRHCLVMISYRDFYFCLSGPDTAYLVPACREFDEFEDWIGDGDVDLRDFADFQLGVRP